MFKDRSSHRSAILDKPSRHRSDVISQWSRGLIVDHVVSQWSCCLLMICIRTTATATVVVVVIFVDGRLTGVRQWRCSGWMGLIPCLHDEANIKQKHEPHTKLSSSRPDGTKHKANMKQT